MPEGGAKIPHGLCIPYKNSFSLSHGFILLLGGEFLGGYFEAFFLFKDQEVLTCPSLLN
jgi:hypothetical protein